MDSNNLHKKRFLDIHEEAIEEVKNSEELENAIIKNIITSYVKSPSEPLSGEKFLNKVLNENNESTNTPRK